MTTTTKQEEGKKQKKGKKKNSKHNWEGFFSGIYTKHYSVSRACSCRRSTGLRVSFFVHQLSEKVAHSMSQKSIRQERKQPGARARAAICNIMIAQLTTPKTNNPKRSRHGLKQPYSTVPYVKFELIFF